MTDNKKICHVCGKEKKSYNVFIRNNYFDLLHYNMARQKGEICQRCDQYYAMTSEFKDATDKEFEDAKKARNFANMMLAWWEKDESFGNRLNSEDGLREWGGTVNISKWARKYLSKKNINW